jgi:peptide-methionine (S)-S-oxide reductase
MSIPKISLSKPLWLGLSVIALGAIIFSSSIFSLSKPSISTPIATKNIPAYSTDIPSNPKGEQTAILAGGCFWGMEAVFENLKGVSNVVSGFSGGSAKTATYDVVSSGKTNHAEAIKITYDPAQISYDKLLQIYFGVAHDPTQLNYQGPDHGPQYRSAIFFGNLEQQRIAQSYIAQLKKAHAFAMPIVTKLEPLETFYAADESHQNFIARNPNYPYVVEHDLPKLKQLRAQFLTLLKS